MEDDISNIQRKVLIVIDKWVKTQKTPVPRSHVIEEMKNQGIEDFTTIFSLNSVMSKGYIRRAITFDGRNKTLYVQLRTIRYE